MPELPEVETITRTLAPQVEGRFICKAELLAAKTLQAGQEFWPLLEGARINKVRRRAKLLLLELTDNKGGELIAAFHLKMTGRLFVHPLDVEPHKHTKITMGLCPAPGATPEIRLFFDDMRTFGYCRLMRPEALPEWPFWARLGLEPLTHSAEELADRLAVKKGRIKNVLLDQTVIAGIGNIYADESLFRAGIRPDAKREGIDKKRLIPLARHVQEILQEAIDACGSSIRDYRDADGNAGAFQNKFKVYGRGGQSCAVCGSTLTSARVAGRGTVFCERCQK